MKRYPIFRGTILAIAVAALCLAINPNSAKAAGYPERAITILVGYAPGSSIDLATRAIAAGAQKYLGQAFSIENKVGASGTVALALCANARPDGYTLAGVTSGAIVRTPQLQKVPFKPLRDLTPLVSYAFPLNAIVVKADAPWKNLKELVDYARKNPNKIKYSTTGVGSTTHHGMQYIAVKENIKMVHVPYQGSMPALTAVLGGHVDVGSVGPNWVPYTKSGQVRVLALEQDKRAPNFPDIPTMKEQGYDFSNEASFALVGPAKLPADIVKRLEAAFHKGMETPEFEAVAKSLDLAPAYYDSKAFGAFLKDTWFGLEKSMKETGLMTEPATQPY